jgi:Ca-activated chloride channel family protein
MRTIVSGFMALFCASMLVQIANAQSAPVLRPVGQTTNSEPGEPPPPPILRKAPAAAANSEEPKKLEATAKDQAEVSEDETLRTNTSLITVPAQVMDRNGRYIGSLKKEDFVIFENGVEQDVTYFGSVEQPFTVALLLDVSGSTQAQMQAIRGAANAFINRLRPNDQIILVTFDGKINVLTEAVKVSELRKLKLRLDAVNDGTLLYDTVNVVLNQRLSAIKGRKAIVLLTDGVDQGSLRSSRRQNLHDANESDVMFYTVQYNTLPQLPERLSQIADVKVRARIQARMEKEYAIGGSYLRTLAEETGGHLYNADSLTDIRDSFGAIMDELGRQYSLGYYPKGQAHPGERRDIKVRVRVPNLVVKARDSYVANAAPAKQSFQD